MRTKVLILMPLCLFVGFFLGVYFGSPLRPYLSSFTGGMLKNSQIEKDESVIEPKIRVPELEPFQSILGKVVFVTKGIYGGDLRHNCILRGKVRNVTNKPYKDVYVLWVMYRPDGKPFPVNTDKYSDDASIMPSIFLDRIDYLDSKSEADFQIHIDTEKLGILHATSMGKRVGPDIDSAKEVMEAVKSGREEAGIFIRKESSK